MIFIVHYDRPTGKLKRFLKFEDDQWATAQAKRLEIELDLNRRGVQHQEVVMLEASDEEALRRTHRRYFETLTQLSEPAID